MIEKIRTYYGRIRGVKTGEVDVTRGWLWRCTQCEEIWDKEPESHKCVQKNDGEKND